MWIGRFGWIAGTRPEARISIGDGSRFGEGLFIQCATDVTIGRSVLGSERVFISDTYHRFDDLERPIIDQPMAEGDPVLIDDGAFLGIGCCILAGVTVGRNAVVGANSVVTKDVPPGTVVVGSPARVVRVIAPS